MTTSVVGLHASIGDPTLDQLGAWFLPFDLLGLWEVLNDAAVTFEVIGSMLVIRPTDVVGLAPTAVIRSIARYRLSGSDPFYWRMRPMAPANDGTLNVELRSNYSAGGVGNFVATADVNAALTGEARYRFSWSENPDPDVSVSFSEPYDEASHRWFRLVHDSGAGKVRWQAAGIAAGPWVTKLETNDPSDSLALTGLRLTVSADAGDTGVGGSGGEQAAWFGPWMEELDDASLVLFTSVDPLPEFGIESRVNLLTEVGDTDPTQPEPPE